MGVVGAVSRGDIRARLDGKLVELGIHDLASLDLAYAISTHKAQGSQFDTVIIPIARPSARAAWWMSHFDGFEEFEPSLRTFWTRIAETDEPLVIWFARHSAIELSFFLSLADRLGERPYAIVDLTGMRFAFGRRDGSFVAQSVSTVPADGLRSLLGKERSITGQEQTEARRLWQRLREENAPFRVVTENGLVSAQADHFDPLLLDRATAEWRKVARVIGDAMGHNAEPYFQVGELMLLRRIVALVDEGKLLAEGDPCEMHACRVRLPVQQ
jgi:Protein of unknown function